MCDHEILQQDELQNGFTILVVDDEGPVRRVLAEGLREAGYHVASSVDGAEALRFVAHNEVDLVLLDINMPGHDGLETLRRIKRLDRDLAVAMMSGYGTIERAVDATKHGAEDFLCKPFRLESLRELVSRIEIQKRARAAIAHSSRSEDRYDGRRRLITSDPAMRRTIEFIDRIAPLPSTVLVEGESGTGKELIAREIHARSLRAKGRFIAFNCAAVPAQLVESELFGYERGAFTGAGARKMGYFEAADGGTLFIDEIAETSPELQTKLLRVIQERSFRRVGGIEEIGADLRIIAATNRDLQHEVAAGRFREDLYYRIKVMKVEVPPLRERPQDILLLSQYFVRRFSQAFRKTVVGLDREVLELLLRCRWTGNVRELQNSIEHAVALARGREVTVADLPDELVPTAPDVAPPHAIKPYQEAKREFENDYLTRALEEAEGNIALASRMTGISRQHLYDKLARHRIEQTDFRRHDEPGDVA